MSDQAPRSGLSPLLLAVSALGNFMLAAGILGIVSPETFPALARPTLAWALISIGALIDGYAVWGIVSATKRQR